MDRLIYGLGFVVLVGCAAVIIASSAGMPPMVASHFDASGRGGSFMARADYELLMLGVAVGLPLFLAFVLAIAPSMAPGMLNVPNARAWLSGPHQAEARRTLAVRGALMAIFLACFITVVHLLVVAANRVVPPRLDGTHFATALAAFMLGMAWWTVSLMLYFRRGPPSR
ncbi:MAG TPA: hypothetical protein VII48_01920 [Rhizomicrobium sp.]